MNTVSTKTRSVVKPKSGNNVAFPDSGDLQLEIPPAEQPRKPAQAQDLQKSNPGAADAFKLSKDLAVLPGRCDGRGLSLVARYTLSVIHAYLGVGKWGALSADKISWVARCSRWTVIKAVNELEASGDLEVDRHGKCHWYRVPPLYERVAKIWVNPSLVRDDGLSIIQAAWISLVKFRQGANPGTWLTHKKAAEILGVSYATIYRAAAWCAALGYVSKDHRSWRRSSKNSYTLTGKADAEIGVFSPKTARSKLRALGQTIVEGGKPYARSARLGIFSADSGLSFDSRLDGQAYAALQNIGVRWRVARSIAVQWRGCAESVRNIVIIGLFARQNHLRRMRRLRLRSKHFNLAGYVIRGLNMAKSEGHKIQLTTAIKAELAQGEDRARAAGGGGVIDSEFEHRRQEQQRRLLSAPAKHVTHYTEDELTIIKRQCDKPAQDAKLREAQAAARCRYHGGYRYANLSKKFRVSVVPCSLAESLV